MMALLFEFVVRTSLIAAGTAVVLWLLRIKTANVRHAAWTAVMVTMLLLPAWVAGGIRLRVPVLQPAAQTTAGNTAGVETDLVRPPAAQTTMAAGETTAASSAPPAMSSASASLNWTLVLLIAYVAGAAALFLRLIIGTAHANRLRRRALMCDGRLTSRECVTPITIGWFAPTLILPDGWQHWPTAKLDAVLTHEREHARRHDPLIQWLAVLNRAVFWCYPLAWWLERRLSTLAEEACDAAVLVAGHSPQDYSEYLLEMARSVTRRGRRVQIVGMAMPGHGLSQRMRQMFEGLPTTPASRARVTCTAVFCVASSVMFAAGAPARRSGLPIDIDPSAVMSTPAIAAPAPFVPVKAAADQKFELAAIRPCSSDLTPPPGRSGGWPRRAQVTPISALWECLTVDDFVFLAYASPATGNQLLNSKNIRRSDDPEPVRGGPSWAHSDRFTIEAKAAVVTDQATLTVQMLRGLLEDRFLLKTHRATEGRPVYVLTVAKGGLNTAKVKPTAPDDCVIRVPGAPLPPRSDRLPCGAQDFFNHKNGAAEKLVRWTGTTFKDFLNANGGLMDRVVIDQTGLDGRFNIEFDFLPDDRTPGYPGSTDSGAAGGGQSIFKALEGAGLHLEPSKASAEYMVIDRVERPKADGISTDPKSPQAPAPAAPTLQIKFQAVSIRLCDTSAPSNGRGGGVSMRNSITPGYASWGCVSLAELIDQAWGGGAFPNNTLLNTIRVPPGQRPDAPKRIRGGPSWIENERYAIEIRLSGDATNLTGSAHHNAVLTAMAPALRAMLEERFQLKLRKATEELPMYALAIAPGGLKLTPVDPNKCYEVTAEQRAAAGRVMLPPPPPGFEGTLPCGYDGYASHGGGRNGNQFMEFTRIPMKDMALWLSRNMDRYVLDKTGVDGRFNFTIEYMPDDSTPGEIETQAIFAEARRQLRPDQVQPPPVKGDGPTIFKALETLGLTLQKTKGPAEYLLIESAQKPTPGLAPTVALRPAGSQ